MRRRFTVSLWAAVVLGLMVHCAAENHGGTAGAAAGADSAPLDAQAMNLPPAMTDAQMAAMAACGNTAATADGSSCENGLQCRDVTNGAAQLPLNACACPSTGLPPTCSAVDASSCAAFPGTRCQDPGAAAGLSLGQFCLPEPALCTPNSAAIGQGMPAQPSAPVATAGTLGTDMAPAAVPAVDPNCGADLSLPKNADGCAHGLECSSILGNYVCVCPKTKISPSCDPADAMSCSAYPGASCQTVQGTSTCVLTCLPEGAAPVGCPSGTMCVDPLGLGTPYCSADGLTPPPCPNGPADCVSFGPDFVCLAAPVVGMGCLKSCTL